MSRRTGTLKAHIGKFWYFLAPLKRKSANCDIFKKQRESQIYHKVGVILKCQKTDAYQALQQFLQLFTTRKVVKFGEKGNCQFKMLT